MTEEKKINDNGDSKLEQPMINKEENLRSLVERSIKLSEEVYEQNKKINKRLRNIVWGSYLRLALIIIPIIVGIIYLPPFFSQIFGQYQDLLGINTGLSTEQLTNFTTPNQIKEIIQLLK